MRKAVSTQHLLYCRVFQVIYFCDFLPARKSASVKCCCFTLWPCDAALWEDAEMHCSYSGLWIYVLFPDAEESTGLNDEQAASALLPIKKLIVCPSRKGNDPLGFSCTSLTHTASQIQLLLTLCACIQRASIFFMSLWILILSFNPFLHLLYPRIISSGNFCTHLQCLTKVAGRKTDQNEVLHYVWKRLQNMVTCSVAFFPSP